jgi:O-antigen ligase
VNSSALRTLVLYAIVLPLAVFIGWMAVDLPVWDRKSFILIGFVLLTLLVPILLRWHYEALIFALGAPVAVFFLPGQPTLWMLMVAINLGIAVLNRVMLKRPLWIPAPSITLSLLALTAVVLVTLWARGGGLAVFGGSTYGGRGYVYVLGGILAYFAVVSRPISADRARQFLGMFTLPGLISLGSMLILFAGPAFYILFLLFPVGFAATQYTTGAYGLQRFAAFTTAGPAVVFFLLAIYGLRGVLTKPWRLAVFVLALCATTLGGFRTPIVLLGLLVLILFILEGLHRTKFMLGAFVALILAALVIVPFASQMPRAVQRSLSFLPVEIDPWVRRDAEGSSEWRLLMWRSVLPQVPQYFWLGKGYVLNPTDLYLSTQAMKHGRARQYESSLAAGDYHNGPLSLYIPLGIFGTLAFIVFSVASLRALTRNYLYGQTELQGVNRFLLGYFLTNLIFFAAVFGSFYSELFKFTTTVGLSVALNRGICRKPFAPLPEVVRRRKPDAPGTALPAPA